MFETLETSISVWLLREARAVYYSLVMRCNGLYINSQIYKLAKAFGEIARVNLKYSFLGKITEIREENDTPIFSNSRFIKILSGIFKEQRYGIIDCLKTSAAMKLTRRIKKELYCSSVKDVGIIVFVAVLTNIIFSALLRLNISLIGGVVRGILLFIGFGGLFCDAPRGDLKKTSVVLKADKNQLQS